MHDERNDHQDDAGHDVAAGLGGADIPDLKHGLLSSRRQQRTDGAPEFWSLGHQVKCKQRDGKDVEQRKNNCAAKVHETPSKVGGTSSEFARFGHSSPKLIQVDRLVDVVLQPCFQRADSFGGLVHQIGDLLGNDLAHCNAEACSASDDQQEDQPCAEPSPHASAFEQVDNWLDRKR